MSAYPTWTPAPRQGIIPLHPLTFGTILGRSFSALRHNPKVLLGFALGVQTLAYILIIAGTGGAAWFSYSRLDTLRPNTDEWDAVMLGSTLITGLTGFALGLLATALQVIVQGVVVSEVAHAAVAEKMTVGALWRRVKPVVWRLIGYSFLVLLAVIVLVGAVTGIVVVFALSNAEGLAIALTVVAVIGAIPLFLWLSTKLVLVPSAIILERATIRGAVARSWTLIRGRFWVALGVTVVISLIFGTISQFVSIPFSLIGAGIGSIFSPTGDPSASGIVTLVVTSAASYVIVLLVQSISIVVAATASVLVYIDCRMRREALDIDLLGYVERRDSGVPVDDLPDPWLPHPERPTVRPVWDGPAGPGYGAPAYPPPVYPGQAYPAPVYPGQAYPPANPGPAYPSNPGPAYPPPAYPGPAYPAPAHPGQAYPPPAHPGQAYPPPANPGQAPDGQAYPATPPPSTPATDAPPSTPAAPPASTSWAAPGAPADAENPDRTWP